MHDLDTLFFEYLISIGITTVFAFYMYKVVGSFGLSILVISALFLTLIYLDHRVRVVNKNKKDEARARRRAVAVLCLVIIAFLFTLLVGMNILLDRYPIDLSVEANEGLSATLNATHANGTYIITVDAMDGRAMGDGEAGAFAFDQLDCSIATTDDAPLDSITIQRVDADNDSYLSVGDRFVICGLNDTGVPSGQTYRFCLTAGEDEQLVAEINIHSDSDSDGDSDSDIQHEPEI